MPPISLSSLQSSIDTLTTDTAQIDTIRAYLRLLGPAQEAVLAPSDPEADAYFGSSACMNDAGDVVIIAAPYDDGTGPGDSGAAYIFSNSGGSWSQVAKLVPSDPQASAYFGMSVSMNATGDVAIIGAPYDDGIGVAASGAAYIFSNSGGSWTQTTKLLPSDPEASAYFGYRVSMNAAGNVVIIGAYNDDGPGWTNSGAAYIFSNSGGSWTQTTKLVPSDPEASAYFGFSVSMNAAGDVVLIGANGDDGNGAAADSGAAYIFSNSGGSWTQTTKLLPTDPQLYGSFGNSVSLNATGDVAIIGAPLDEGTGGVVNSGAAYIFSNSGGSWTQTTKLLPSDPETSAQFGLELCINAAGNVAIIGAKIYDGAGPSDSGAVYIFSNFGSGWVQTGKLVASDPEASAYFGSTVQINSAGNVMIIGESGRDFGGSNNTGLSYIFRGVV